MSATASSIVPFAPPTLGPEEIAEVVATPESGWLTTGPRVASFERRFADYVGAPHAYPALLDEAAAGMSRDRLPARLRAHGISTSVHFRAVHLHPYYQERFGFRRGMFPIAESVSDTTLSLPLSAAMPDEAIDQVIEACHDVLR